MTTTDLARSENGALATVQPTHAGLAMSFDEMRHRVRLLDQFYRDVMQPGTDYDVIPGTPKPSLFQPGAQLLDAIFGLVPKFEEIDGTIRDYDKGFFAYEIRCALVNKATGEIAAEGIGSCNSMEGRYRWRDAKRQCPECGLETIIRGKAEYGGGWLCFKKAGGCGAKFPDGASEIERQPQGKVENDDPYTLANTMLKMAQKRAHVAATLNATGASRIFTQDVEDMGDLVGSAQERAVQRQEPPAQRQQAPDPNDDPSEPSRDDKVQVYRRLCLKAAKWNADDTHQPIEFKQYRNDWSDDQLNEAGHALGEALKKVSQPKAAAAPPPDTETVGAGIPETDLPF